MRGIPTLAVLLVACATAAAKPAARTAKPKPGAHPRLAVPDEPPATPAFRYAQLDADACLAELDARDIPYKRETAAGVANPVRLTGPLHGVTFKTDVPEKQRATTPWEIGDCALVLAMDDFAKILETHDVVEVRHYSMYRAPGKTWPEHKVGIQHIGGTALDAARFVKSDGDTLDVLKDFHGAIGARTCGDGAAPHPATAKAVELREILCDAVEQHLFNVVLTPDYNRPHKNHFHLEVMRGVKWFLVH